MVLLLIGFFFVYLLLFFIILNLHSVPGVSQTVYKITPKNVVARQEDVPNFIVCAGCHNCCNRVGCLGCGEEALTQHRNFTNQSNSVL